MIGRPKPPPRDAAARIREHAGAARSPAPGTAPTVAALGIAEPGGLLVPLRLPHRAPGPGEVAIEVRYCSVCACDVRAGRAQGSTGLPLVPGHGIVGVVAETGPGVRELEPGTLVGVGAVVDGCGTCAACRGGAGRDCIRAVPTYGARNPRTGEHTRGGYAKRILVHRDFVLHIAPELEPARAAALFCPRNRAHAVLGPHPAGEGTAPLVGSEAETRQLPASGAEELPAADIELVGADELNETWERIAAGPGHRMFVLDLATWGGND